MQMSAVGVWGTPVALACRAADLVALPTSQLLSRANQHYGVMFSSICHRAIRSITNAADMLNDSDCSSRLMSRPELIGMCTA
jgi:hypothetical protein